MQKPLVEYHEEIFDFLYQKHIENSEFRFRMRKKNNKKRLNNGYWFNGDEGYLTLSFWNGDDTKSKQPCIRLGITPKHNIMWSDYIARSSELRRVSLKELAELNSLEPRVSKKGEFTNIWGKIYTMSNQNWKEIIENFIDKDKKVIDTFIKNKLNEKYEYLDGIDFIKKEEFDKWIKNINKYRK